MFGRHSYGILTKGHVQQTITARSAEEAFDRWCERIAESSLKRGEPSEYAFADIDLITVFRFAGLADTPTSIRDHTEFQTNWQEMCRRVAEHCESIGASVPKPIANGLAGLPRSEREADDLAWRARLEQQVETERPQISAIGAGPADSSSYNTSPSAPIEPGRVGE